MDENVFKKSMHDDMIDYVQKLKEDLKYVKWYEFKKRYNLKTDIKTGNDLIIRGILK